MARTKARRMSAFSTLPTACSPADVKTRGGLAACFQAPRPLVVEVGCGKGESLLALAAAEPGRNFLGIDLKSARLYSGARAAMARGLLNVLFIKAEARQVVDICGPAAVDEFWIPFPDPVPRGSKAHKRLISPEHLAIYRSVARPGARLHLKTDDAALFAYALSVIKDERCPVYARSIDLHAALPAASPGYAWSTYERRYVAVGRPIHYVCFGLISAASTVPARAVPEQRIPEGSAIAHSADPPTVPDDAEAGIESAAPPR